MEREGIPLDELLNSIEEKGVVKIIHKPGHNPNEQSHPFEEALARKGIPYEWNGMGSGNGPVIYLNKTEIIYPLLHSNFYLKKHGISDSLPGYHF